MNVKLEDSELNMNVLLNISLCRFYVLGQRMKSVIFQFHILKTALAVELVR